MVPISGVTSTSGIHMVIVLLVAERPVVLILMPRRQPAASFLEQRLVVIDAHAIHAKQISSDPGETPGADELFHAFVLRPKIHALEKGLAVCVALLEWGGFARRICHGH